LDGTTRSEVGAVEAAHGRSPFYAFHPAFWTAVDEEELADWESPANRENYELTR
jgi:hypothetical protein